MPTCGPIKRKELIYYLRQVGFSGPYSGGKHQFMLKGHLRVRIPNPRSLRRKTCESIRRLKAEVHSSGLKDGISRLETT